MNREEKNQILKALTILMNVCNNHQCEYCPLGMDERICMLEAISPAEWELNSEEPIWRAYK